jgi:hypothetical protein
MKRFLRLAASIALIASLAMNAILFSQWLQSKSQFSQWGASIDHVEVMRTKGGFLEVSTIKSPETFVATMPHNILGIDLGATTTSIRVLAFYRYHIALAPEWKVRVRPDKSIVVIAPPVEPTLPVAIDTATIEKQSQGRWSFLTGAAELDELQKTITAKLGQKSGSPSYIEFQRNAARLTVEEFVRKWLLTQDRLKSVRGSPVEIYFADEPISALPQPALPHYREAP